MPYGMKAAGGRAGGIRRSASCWCCLLEIIGSKTPSRGDSDTEGYEDFFVWPFCWADFNTNTQLLVSFVWDLQNAPWAPEESLVQCKMKRGLWVQHCTRIIKYSRAIFQTRYIIIYIISYIIGKPGIWWLQLLCTKVANGAESDSAPFAIVVQKFVFTKCLDFQWYII